MDAASSVARLSVAVIGSGISGLACARTLHDRGYAVFVFEKSRGVGGRMATRRTEDGLKFDHGAQYFTVRDERFERHVKGWLEQGVVAPWHGKIVSLCDGEVTESHNDTKRFVGTPGMNSVCKALATGLDIRFQTRVASIDRDSGRWHLQCEHGISLGSVDAVVTSAPSPQSATLLQQVPELQQQAVSCDMQGCWAAMLAFPEPLGLSYDAAFVQHSPLAWIARNYSKPQRDAGSECWVLHASPTWTASCLDDDQTVVLSKLLEHFWMATRAKPHSPRYAAAHRWRYAIPPSPLLSPFLFDSALHIGACGDWCGGPRVEGAFLSGLAIADCISTSV
jgi:renalase